MDKLTDYKNTRENKVAHESKERLSKILKKKIETTMIGALSSIEEHFSFLWGVDTKNMTKEQQVMYDLYQKIRSEILDKGNSQIRNVDSELSQYEIRQLKYSLVIPIKQK